MIFPRLLCPSLLALALAACGPSSVPMVAAGQRLKVTGSGVRSAEVTYGRGGGATFVLKAE